LEYHLDRPPLLEDTQREMFTNYTTDDTQTESVDTYDWNRNYTNSLYYHQFNSANQNNDIEYWIVTTVLETTNSSSATHTHSNVKPTNVQIDFSSIMYQLNVATSATNYMGNINIEQLMQLRQMVEELAIKSVDSPTTTVATMKCF